VAETLFSGKPHVFDAMVFINFHGLGLLENFFLWANKEIILTPPVKREARSSKMGRIKWGRYVNNEDVIYVPMELNKEQSLFSHYLNREIDGKVIHTGEASALAVAIANNWGLVCDEIVVRKEYYRVTHDTALHSWALVELAVSKGFIDRKEAEWIKKGLYYV